MRFVVMAMALLCLSAPARAAQPKSLVPLVDLMTQRVMIADQVAAAKVGTTSPVHDPVREKMILDGVATKAPESGLAPETTVEFFADQIAAGEVVRYGLFSRWSAHPDEAPTTRLDLPGEV